MPADHTRCGWACCALGERTGDVGRPLSTPPGPTSGPRSMSGGREREEKGRAAPAPVELPACGSVWGVRACACMCMIMRVSMCVCARVFVCVFVHVSMHVHARAFVRVIVHVSMHVRARVYVCVQNSFLCTGVGHA